jgi:NADH:ubiquinone oxidoreductase subunit E
MLEEVEVQKLLEKYSPAREHLLEMLHDLQDHSPQHYLSDDAMAAVASYLGLALSDVKGTASFYSMFSFTPRGRHLIRICTSPPCQLLGATTIQAKLQEKLHVAVGETTVDGAFTLETTSCLGVCGVAPAMMIDTEVYGNLTPERIEAIIDKMRREDEAS